MYKKNGVTAGTEQSITKLYDEISRNQPGMTLRDLGSLAVAHAFFANRATHEQDDRVERNFGKERAVVEEFLLAELINTANLLPIVDGQESIAERANMFDDLFNGTDVFAQWGKAQIAIDFTHAINQNTIMDKMGVSDKRFHEFGSTTVRYYKRPHERRREYTQRPMLHVTLGTDAIEDMLRLYDLNNPTHNTQVDPVEAEKLSQEKSQITEKLQFKFLEQINEQLIVHIAMAERDIAAKVYYDACVEQGIRPADEQLLDGPSKFTTVSYVARYMDPNAKSILKDVRQVLTYIETTLGPLQNKFDHQAMVREDRVFSNIIQIAQNYMETVRNLTNQYKVLTKNILSSSAA